MIKYFFASLFTLLLLGCKINKEANDFETYTFLNICFEDYYLNFDIEISPLLNNFEILLIEEGHLSDSSGKAYKALFDSLQKTDYFKPPLRMENFNNSLLYKNPTNVMDCAVRVFSLDSAQILNTNFSKVTQEINSEVSENKDVSIHYFFNLYRNKLTNEELRMPYVKQSIQLLLYRWYFKSKYDREIQIKMKEKTE
ncbi:MAG TPA: hypothetical protein VKX29_03015 [Brumimicrobium sp.]|nr:hypothetical protein [Brumimicrobium sp.]